LARAKNVKDSPAAMKSPLGVTLIALLMLVASIYLLSSAIISGTIIYYLSTLYIPGALLAFIGGFALIIGLIFLLIAFGLWRGMKWAWWIAVLFYGLSVVLSLYYFSLPPLVVSGLILFYLTRSNVKKYFDVRFSLKLM